ncbi:hypothetical protein [Leptospira limi]|uniref:DUF1282 domain-containing protein n=1 Tax=Leptospira limi TaxID=2950023 RepID=A0ABT3LUU9_9LEPT|nr:hypothetical protein [Leptospira limi]MCW7461494.1 hypothetical protein [Leptospira limi]
MQKVSTITQRMQLIRDLFYSPMSAFESYYHKADLGGRDLWFAHLQLMLLAPIAKFLGNCIQILIFKVSFVEEETRLTYTQGVGTVFFFYLGFYFVIRLVDSFRMYHQMRDRTKDWEGPEPHVFIISFLAFTATSIFWIFPAPIPLFMLAVGFLYSLHLSYFYLSIRRTWSSFDFLFFLMKVVLFFLVLLSVPLFLYNLIRTVLF